MTAETLRLKISYLGIKAVNVFSTYRQGNTGQVNIINVEAVSTSLGSLVNRLDNSYTVFCTPDFRPVKYTKKINQRNINDTITTTFNNYTNQIETSFFETGDTYTIEGAPAKTRDFFSTLYYIRNNFSNIETDSLYVKSNNNIWQVRVKKLDYETIRTIFGMTETIKTRINFVKITDREEVKSDILTNNLVNPENDLYFWFTNDYRKIPVKAEYKRSRFSVYWDITYYEE